MKNLNRYIQESILDDDEDIDNKKLSVQPKTKSELYKIIVDTLKSGNKNLNFIDTSKIEDMNHLFDDVNMRIKVKDIDISEWDVSKVKDMSNMFDGCHDFNCDLSNWDVSSVESMNSMFGWCEKFNSDISNWNVSKVKNFDSMFWDCESFDQDLNKWKVNTKRTMYMFKDSKLETDNKLPRWYKE